MAEVDIVVRTIGPSPPSRLRIASHIRVADLRKLVAEERHLPLEQLKLVLRGEILRDTESGSDVFRDFREGDLLMVAVAPKPPTGQIHDGDDDDLVPDTAVNKSLEKDNFYLFTGKNKGSCLKGWVLIFLWFIMAPVAHKWDLGPIYILGTGFAIILVNLGHRQQDELSAFSIFNEDFRELPGTFNAERVDRDLRAGQL